MVGIFLFSFLKTYAFSIMSFYTLLIHMVPKKLLILIVSVALILLSILFYFYQQKTTWITPVEISTPNEYITPPQIDIWSMENTGVITSSGISQIEQSLSGSLISGENVSSILNTQICLFDICIDSTKPLIRQKDGTIIQAYEDQYTQDNVLLWPKYTTVYDNKKMYTQVNNVNISKG